MSFAESTQTPVFIDVDAKIANTNETLSNTCAQLNNVINQGFADLQAMLKSHLDCAAQPQQADCECSAKLADLATALDAFQQDTNQSIKDVASDIASLRVEVGSIAEQLSQFEVEN